MACFLDFMLYANNELNAPACSTQNAGSSSINSAAFISKSTPSGENYLLAQGRGSQLSNSKISFLPEIVTSNLFDVYVSIPACGVFDSCETRAIVSVDVYLYNLDTPASSIILNESVTVSTLQKIYSGVLPVSSVNSGLPLITVSLTQSYSKSPNSTSFAVSTLKFVETPQLTGLNGLVYLNTQSLEFSALPGKNQKDCCIFLNLLL
jgi:hypothetical protein